MHFIVVDSNNYFHFNIFLEIRTRFFTDSELFLYYIHFDLNVTFKKNREYQLYFIILSFKYAIKCKCKQICLTEKKFYLFDNFILKKIILVIYE
jgi:hypothetical protein